VGRFEDGAHLKPTERGADAGVRPDRRFQAEFFDCLQKPLAVPIEKQPPQHINSLGG